MESEAQHEHHQLSSIPKLSPFRRTVVLSKPQFSPERSGALTSPLHKSASVPFRWEEEPGKPRSSSVTENDECYNFAPEKKKISLELPPRLYLSMAAKLQSPTKVLQDPYSNIVGRQKFQSSSFRILRTDHQRRWFVSSSTSWERKPIGFISGKREPVINGGGIVFPSSSSSSMDRDDQADRHDHGGTSNATMIRRKGTTSSRALSSPSQARFHFWAVVHESLKQVVPWSSRKQKKERKKS